MAGRRRHKCQWMWPRSLPALTTVMECSLQVGLRLRATPLRGRGSLAWLGCPRGYPVLEIAARVARNEIRHLDRFEDRGSHAGRCTRSQLSRIPYPAAVGIVFGDGANPRLVGT